MGVNWNDVEIIQDAKLYYDSAKLYILSFFNQESKIIKKEVAETKKDIVKRIQAQRVTDTDEAPQSKFKLRHVYKDDVIISDDANKSWSVKEILSNPGVASLFRVTFVTVSVILLKHNDATISDVVVYSYGMVKAGCVSSVRVVGKIIKFFTGGTPPRPPIAPTSSPMDINLAMILPDGKPSNVASGSFIGPVKPPFYDVIQSSDVFV